MGEERDGRTDSELAGILDEPGRWVVRAGEAAGISEANLRAALFQAFNLSGAGFRVTNIGKVPDDAVVVSVAQIHRLWWRIGLLGG
jgi:hypothetical protein